MKLIYIANNRIPTEKAHGIQIMQMCTAFSKYGAGGIELELIVPRRINPIKEDSFKYYGMEKTFKIKKLPCIDAIPFDFILGNLSFWIQTITFLISAKLYLAFKKYDILYTRERFASLFFKNYFLEIHSLPDRIKNFYKKLWGRAKKLIVMTGPMKEELIKKGVNPEKIIVAPDSVDIKRFNVGVSKEEAREKIGLPQDKELVIYTGHLFEWKGVDILAKSAELLQNALFIFVGGTEKDIFEFKNRFGKIKNILVLGHKSYAEIPLYQRAADVLVLPNKEEERVSKFYTSPMKLFEYMVSQRPIVASDLPSIREVLNGENAILVKSNNSIDLAKGIEQALQDRNFASKISQQAFLDVQIYTWDERAKKIFDRNYGFQTK